jgi:CBS domain containing-hemolysin-like protein
MDYAVWLFVLGYLMIALGELIPTGFRSSHSDLRAHLAVCGVALAYALLWPLRYWREARNG